MSTTMNNNNITSATNAAIKVLKNYIADFTEMFPTSTSVNNFYVQSENVEWTTGFWTGCYWLAYELTNDERFKSVATQHVQSFLHRIENRVDVEHHDMGFLYSLSCVAAYKLTGNKTGKQAALLAADNLISRFNTQAQFVQAWGSVGAKDNFRLIIDCLLNMPLLYWASEVSGDPKYKDIATAHTQTSLDYLVREDYSTYHTYFFDVHTYQPLYGKTHQGYKDDSAWARGQAWGVYGLAFAYKYTKNEKCIELFRKVTNYFIEHLPSDNVAYWDLTFTSGDEPRDSSASAIVVCGILEMIKYLTDEQEIEYYRSWAVTMLHALIETCAVSDTNISNGLLLHGTYAKKSPYNPIPRDRGVDECNTWGDYFYLEALTRLSIDWKLYW